MLPTDSKLYYDFVKREMKAIEKRTNELIKEGKEPKKAWREAKEEVFGWDLKKLPLSPSPFKPVAKPPDYILANPMARSILGHKYNMSIQKIDRFISEYKLKAGKEGVDKITGMLDEYMEESMSFLKEGRAPGKPPKFADTNKILEELFKKYKITDSRLQDNIKMTVPMFTPVDAEMIKIKSGEIELFTNYFYSAHDVLDKRITKERKLKEQSNSLHEHAHNILGLAMLKKVKDIADWKKELFSEAFPIIVQTKQLAESKIKADNWKVADPENRKEFFEIKERKEEEVFELLPGMGVGLTDKPHLRARNVMNELLDLDTKTMVEKGPSIIRKIVFDGRIRTPEQAIKHIKKYTK
jgi:hypothetical protein